MTDRQPTALRLADDCDEGMVDFAEVAAELRRLHAENEALRKAYWKMRNSAAGYSNYCDDSASVRRCERDFVEAEDIFRAAIAKVEGKQ